jgi:glycosyltransferase involved in cell wall biosynthesis
MLTNSVYTRDTRVKRYAESLADLGHFVDVVCLASESSDVYSYPRVEVCPIPMSRKRREGLGLAWNWAACAALMAIETHRLWLTRGHDLIHVHNVPDFLVLSAFLPRLRGVPVVLNIHDPTPELTRSKFQIPANHWLVKAHSLMERLCIAFSAHVITATESFKTILVGRGVRPEKITVIPNGVNRRIFNGGPSRRQYRAPDAETCILLYVGTVAARYGVDVCVRALPIIRQEVPGVRLWIVPKIKNEGKALDDCLRLAVDLGAQDLIILKDPVPVEAMPDIMNQADIGVYPGLSDCHIDTAMSLKIPEMALMGLPIVATRLPVLEELFGETGAAYYPSGDHQAMAKKIIELWKSEETRRSMAEEAFVRASSLDWDLRFPVYKRLLESLLRRRL